MKTILLLTRTTPIEQAAKPTQGLTLFYTDLDRKAVEVGAKQVTGFPLTIGAVNIGIFTGSLEVDNLKLMNPPEFKEPMFVDLPLFKVDYVTFSMLSGAPATSG